MAFIPEELYGIIGHPLGHSLSPLLFGTLFAQLGRPAAYCRWDVEPERVGGFMTAVRVLGIRGVSVTIPHKEAVIPFLDRLSERARAAGAVNTLYWDGDHLCGENTDIAGFLAPLGGRAPRRALVLGNGGAARAVLSGLRERRTESVLVAGRSQAKTRELARDFGADVLPWEERTQLGRLGIDLVVNATPLGMQGGREKETPLPAEGFAGTIPGLAYDLVYRPRPTRFLGEAAAAGWTVQDGLAMFLAQARMQFRLWTGGDWTPALVDSAARTLDDALGAHP